MHLDAGVGRGCRFIVGVFVPGDFFFGGFSRGAYSLGQPGDPRREI